MRTYDSKAGTHGTTMHPWMVAWRVLRRWLDRERELLCLRNAVGMMAEARRGDAAEYDEMREHNKTLYARVKAYEQMEADRKVRVQACRPEDRAMLNSTAGRELLAKATTALIDGETPERDERVATDYSRWLAGALQVDGERLMEFQRIFNERFCRAVFYERGEPL